MLRWLDEAGHKKYDGLINILLDRLNNLKKLENEINEKLRNQNE
jgi:hypothetical protein